MRRPGWLILNQLTSKYKTEQSKSKIGNSLESMSKFPYFTLLNIQGRVNWILFTKNMIFPHPNSQFPISNQTQYNEVSGDFGKTLTTF